MTDLAHLDGYGHTITVETLDPTTARHVGRPSAIGLLAVIERTDGRLGTIRCVDGDQPPGVTIEQTAQGCASTLGARYLPAPAERILPGVALQRVNITRPDGSVHHYSYNGTEEEARLYGQLLLMHDTHPDYQATLARFTELRNQRRALDQR